MTKKDGLSNKTKPIKRQKCRRKGILIFYYLIAAIVILFNCGVLLNSFCTVVETIESEEEISFQTNWEDDDTLELGTQEIKQAGENGIKKIYTEEKKRLITGEKVDSNVAKIETIKEPVNEIIRRGTRRWQYMICSNGDYWYFTDEQFQNKDIGYTSASEDQCAENNQGYKIALSDTPPSRSSFYSSNPIVDEDYINTVGTLTPIKTWSQWQATELTDDSNEDTQRQAEEAQKQAEEAQRQAEEAQKQAEEAAIQAQKDRLNAQNTCNLEASMAGQSLRRQVGAMGGGGSIEYQIQEMVKYAYSSCMARYGY